MSSFVDGPMAGQALFNERAPIFLRAVLDAGGKPDCLDLPEDVAAPSETIHVYERVPGSYRGRAFVTLDRPRRCLSVPDVDYRWRPDVDGESVRDNERWRAWATTQEAPV